ncbi:hypothetical protein TSAR_009319 [Trichomalopsis sarcophagae]|uniref:Reverse transcriptase domain-containing protein n=1 Tax=Trichomalopsis sarcophagae TaxID=543379 RepID=A0A232EL68_9HYME|nr:hypothetical protein TSAR_009319 [Trichomalopsis sarcophagae]
MDCTANHLLNDHNGVIQLFRHSQNSLYKQSALFHPRLNRLFRNKNNSEIGHITVNSNEKNILDSLNIEASEYIDCNNPNKCVIHDEKIIPNIVGKHLEIINTENNENNENVPALRNLVENLIIEKWDALHSNSPLTTFDNNNNALKPMTAELKDVHFTNDIELQNLYNKIKTFYTNWGLKINASKYETILFRNTLSNYTRKNKKIWKQFQLNDVENDIVTPIPHKNHVRYLSVILDERLRFNIHINAQLEKASNTCKKLHKLFYSPYLCKKTKVMAYLTLIRPILTYGCNIWSNVSASYMEKLRPFERKCLRACLRRYRYDYCNYIGNA